MSSTLQMLLYGIRYSTINHVCLCFTDIAFRHCLTPAYLHMVLCLIGLFDAVDAMDRPNLKGLPGFDHTPSFQRGCNFAAAGSTIEPRRARAVSPFSFGVQVAQFVRN
ncbi:hypothetical protein V6N13_141125 [Hibiscus sabdariffa]